MRASQVLVSTLREDPADAEVVSHRLLLRAGMIRPLASGLFTWMPLGVSVLRKVEAIIRDEMNRAGAQEVLMPVVQTADLWRESGRWNVMGRDLLRFVDRNERDCCLSPTHEEVVTDLFRKTVNSYRQLPCILYQIGTKFRDEIRPRFGVLRAREFIMKDAYSFHLDETSFDATYRSLYDAYCAIFIRLGLEFRVVEADPGAIGDGESHEFHVLAESGEDAIAYSPASDYAANVERAEAPIVGTRLEGAVAMTRTATPDVSTIHEVTHFLNVDPKQTVKTLVLRGRKSLVAVTLRGDHELNEAKAARLPEVAIPFEFADEKEIQATIGCSIGSIGPVNLNLPIYVDRSASTLSDFVCGANEDGFHYQGVNWERDVPLERVVDVRTIQEGEMAPDGSGPVRLLRGIEVGHIFQLGDKYTKAMGIEIQDSAGKRRTPLMGCYGIGVSRIVGAIVEQLYDGQRMHWPASVAPCDVHIVVLSEDRSSEESAAAEKIYQACMERGMSVFLDDRNERPGVKFADADLIGIPKRITVGTRALAKGCVEYGIGNEKTALIPVSDIVKKLHC